MYRNITIAALLLALAALLLFLFPRAPLRSDAAREKVAIAVSSDPSSALLFVAEEKGMFAAEGVDVTLLMHTTGKAALSLMEQGKAQLATVADTVLMFAGMDGRPVSVVASLAESSRHHRVIAMKSRGIAAAGDLRGKKIGVPLRTTGEFFLYTFLLFRGIPLADVTLVDMPPERMAAALENGTVDAVAVFFPTVTRIEERFGSRVSVFEDENYLMAWNLVAGRDFIRQHPETVTRVLKGLVRAQRFAFAHPDEAIAVTSRLSGSDPAVLKRDWTNYRFGIRLSEALVIDLEDQARWALKRYYPGRTAIPDFTDMIAADPLRRIDPAAVGILDRREP